MDDFGCIDYKRPASVLQQDMRTSYYRGHRHLTDTRVGNTFNAKFADKGIYCRDPVLFEKECSEYCSNYVMKYADPNAMRNPAMNMKMQHMKPFEHGKLRFVMRSMKPMSSVSSDSYVWKQPEVEPEPLGLSSPSPAATTNMLIDRSKEGCAKYTDPSATTYNLSYVHYTPKAIQGGIAAQDNITFWNWNKFNAPRKPVTPVADEQMCDECAAKDCPKRRLEFQNEVKFVPNSGLSTEVRENYLSPKFRKEYLDFDLNNVTPCLASVDAIPFAKKSEYNIYGSGEQVLKYV